MVKKRLDPPPVESKQFSSVGEIDRGIAKLEKRIKDLKQLDVPTAVRD